MKLTELEAAVEAILFAAGDAVSLPGISLAIGQDTKTAKSIVYSVKDKLEKENRGIEIIEINDSFQMRTSSEYYGYIKTLFQNPMKKSLTQPLLETLAIIAYKQPCTRAQIEEIRGVDATHAVNKLAEYGLVCEKGRSDLPGRAILFGTTDEFLKYYGFTNIDVLPELPEADEQLRLEAEDEIR